MNQIAKRLFTFHRVEYPNILRQVGPCTSMLLIKNSQSVISWANFSVMPKLKLHAVLLLPFYTCAEDW